ncbi:unnamed protein product [Gordionus sp. m RMFG-2023]
MRYIIKSFLLLILVLQTIKGYQFGAHRHESRIKRSIMCPPGIKKVNCRMSPCLGTKCRSYPLANCVPNYCGGCYYDYYFNGRKIKCN